MAAFILGVLSSVLAAAFVAWLMTTVSARTKDVVVAFLSNPILQIRIHLSTKQAKITQVIRRIFEAWESKSADAYVACWHAQAVRIVGPKVPAGSHLDIKQHFERSCERYSEIRTESLVFESVRVDYPREHMALVQVHYRQVMLEKDTFLPLIEEAREIYVLVEDQGGWLIRSNFDHFAPNRVN